MIRYNFENVSSQTFNSLKHRVDESNFITNMINSSSDFFLYGGPGSGKT